MWARSQIGALPRHALPLLMAALGYGLALSRGASMLQDPDTYWHIATGDWILRHWAVPHHDPFSFTAAGAPWVDLEWLSEVLMALAYRLGGWSGLVLLAALALGLAMGLLSQRLARWLPPVPNAVLVLLAFLTLLPSLLCRPHVIALPMLVVWAAGLVTARAEGRAPGWVLVPLMALWANLHGSFVAGLGLALVLAVEAVLAAPPGQRRPAALAWGGFVLASVLAACLTPNLLQGLVHPIRMMRAPVMLGAITEWQSPNFQKMQPLEIWLVVGLAVALARGVRLPVVRIVLLLGLMHAGLQHARNEILLGFVGPLILAEPLSRYFRHREAAGSEVSARIGGSVVIGAGVAAVLLTALFARHPIARTDDRVTPRAALAHVPPALAARPVLNAYDFGGYLIFRGVRPFIDGRADMYGDRFFSRYLDLLAPRADKLEATLRQDAIAWTILKPTDGAVALLDTLPGWQRLYADKYAVVHARTALLPEPGITAWRGAPKSPGWRHEAPNGRPAALARR